MRVLFWSELFWPSIGGAEIFSAKLLSALQARGYECAVITDQYRSDLPMQDHYRGIPIYRFPFFTALTDRNVDQILAIRQQVAKLKRAFAPDLVHLHCIGASAFFHLVTALAHNAPLLVTLTEEKKEPPHPHGMLRSFLLAAAWVTGKATAVITQARQLAPEITPHSSVIHNGVKVPSLLPQPLPFAPPRLLCLGRLTDQKGFDLAVTVLTSLVERFPTLRLLIAGDGPERSALEQQVAALGLSEVVNFTGWISPDKVLPLINTATLVLMPSRWEGLPSVALQAAQMARPVVATLAGGLPEIIVHQQTGMLLEQEDSAGLAEAIAFLLEHPEVATQLGQAARQRVHQVFGWDQCVSAYESLYTQLLGEHRSLGVSPSSSIVTGETLT